MTRNSYNYSKKAAHEQDLTSSLAVVSKDVVKMSSGKSDRLSKAYHYIVNTNNIINVSDVYAKTPEVENPGMRLKRIRKPVARYLRFSVDTELNAREREIVLQSISSKFNAKVKQQSLKRNLTVEMQAKPFSTGLLTLLTLNINGLESKLDEFKSLLGRYLPDIICLQETKYSKDENLLCLPL